MQASGIYCRKIAMISFAVNRNRKKIKKELRTVDNRDDNSIVSSEGLKTRNY